MKTKRFGDLIELVTNQTQDSPRVEFLESRKSV